MELYQLTAHDLIKKIKNQETTSGGIAESLRKRIDTVDSGVRGYVRKGSLNIPHTAYHLPPISIKTISAPKGYIPNAALKF